MPEHRKVLIIGGGGGGGSGTVTEVTSANANIAVAFGTTTPELTLNSTLSGINSVTSATGQALTLATLDSNKDIKLVPHGTGNVVVNQSADTAPTPAFAGVQIAGAASGSAGLTVDTFASQSVFLGRRANGTVGSKTALALNDLITGLYARGYGATGYVNASLGAVQIRASEAWTDSAAGTQIEFSTSTNGTISATARVKILNTGTLQFAGARTIPAWGTAGALMESPALTITDTSSSGTVSTAVANSFSSPAFAASSATTFTNAANLYIAGDVAAGTNVTLTNSYGLWNVGKTRLDGAVTLGALTSNGLVTTSGGTGATSVTVPGTGVLTALAVNVGSAGAFITNGGALGTPFSGTLTNCTFPTLNQNTTGSAASLSISGQTGLLTVTGLASTNRVKTVRDAADTILELGGSYTPTGTWTSMTLVTPVLGTPTSGALTNCTADGTNSVGFRGIPQNSQSAAYTTVLADAGKCIFHPSSDANARTFTIDSNANVAYAVGTVIEFINMSANNVTIAITSDTLTLLPAGTTGSRTLAQYGRASAEKISSTAWVISGNSALT